MKLTNKLLSNGGKSVTLGLDTDNEIKRLVNDGKIYEDKVIFVGGTPNQCHRNTAETYCSASKHGFKIVTGYALTKKGDWIQHSWGHNPLGIIESVRIKFKSYFGYELTPEESELFCFENE